MRSCKHPSCDLPLATQNKSGYCLRHRRCSPRRRYKHLRATCKKRGIELVLTLKEFEQIISKRCTYCGREPSNKDAGVWLDRKDSSKGYERRNVVPCCGNCNALKGNILTFKETKAIINALKVLRKADDIWSHKLTTAQKRKKRRK